MADLNTRMTNMTPTDPAVAGVAITGSAQTFNPTGRAILVSTAGSFTGKLIADSADVTYTLPLGIWPLAIKSITSVSSLAGVVLL
jgi:hypothetical protein